MKEADSPTPEGVPLMALMETSDQLYSDDPGENPPFVGPDYELDIPHEVAFPDDMIFPSKPPPLPYPGDLPFPNWAFTEPAPYL